MTSERAAIIWSDYRDWKEGKIDELPYAKPVIYKAVKKGLDDILNMEIEELPNKFHGKGEVKGFRFTKVWTAEDFYIFKVNPMPNEHCHYELVERKLTPVCLNFEKRLYSDTQFKERFPKAKDFGVWAWNYSTLEKALEEGRKKFEHNNDP